MTNNIRELIDVFHLRITQVLEGKGTQGQAVDWIRTFLATDGANALKELGFASVRETNESDRLSELASHRRVTLIVVTNVRMSQAVEEYQSQLESKDIFPYLEYHTHDTFLNPSHRILNGLIFRVGSIEHKKLMPPNGFGCYCHFRQLAEDELEGKIQSGIPPEYLNAQNRKVNSFSFDPSNFDLRTGIIQCLPWSEKWPNEIKNIIWDTSDCIENEEYQTEKPRLISKSISPKKNDNPQLSNRYRVIYILLALFLGCLGIHNFYAGYFTRGIIQLLLSLLTLGMASTIVMIWALIEILTVKIDPSGKKMR